MTVTGTATAARAKAPSPSVLPSDVRPSVAVPLIVPAAAVETCTASDVSVAPDAMSVVGPLDATLRPGVTLASVAIRPSEKPSAGSLLASGSATLPGSPDMHHGRHRGDRARGRRRIDRCRTPRPSAAPAPCPPPPSDTGASVTVPLLRPRRRRAQPGQQVRAVGRARVAARRRCRSRSRRRCRPRHVQTGRAVIGRVGHVSAAVSVRRRARSAAIPACRRPERRRAGRVPDTTSSVDRQGDRRQLQRHVGTGIGGRQRHAWCRRPRRTRLRGGGSSVTSRGREGDGLAVRPGVPVSAVTVSPA